MLRRVAAALVLCLASGAASGSAEPTATLCFGSPATIIAQPNTTTNGTDGPDVIVALDAGQHFIYGHGGDDKICGGAGPESLHGGAGNHRSARGPRGPGGGYCP